MSSGESEQDGKSDCKSSEDSKEDIKLNEITTNQNVTKIEDSSLIIERNSNENETVKILVRNCRDVSEIFKVFESKMFSGRVMLLIFKYVDEIPKISTEDFQKIYSKCINKSVVVVLESKNNENFSIIWKFKDSQHFWSLKTEFEMEIDKKVKLKEFVTNFLVESLEKEHSGLISNMILQKGTTSIDLDFLADSRNLNLLHLAIESGNTELFSIFHKLNLSIKSPNAQELAMENAHFDILLMLLKANLTFPTNFDIKKCTGQLKEFCDTTKELHMLITANNEEEVKRILDEKSISLRHLYNFQNESAVKVAIESHSIETYELLLSRNYFFAPHEDPKAHLRKLDEDDKWKIHEIHNKYSDHLVEKHINGLMLNSHIFRKNDDQHKRKVVQNAFETLSSNVFIRIILMIVAASKNFKIIFDFEQDTVEVVDPAAGENTDGIFYFCGKVYIAAKQLLDETTAHKVHAVMAHELCHLAMHLVFGNHGKPYKSNDVQTMRNFEEVSKDCQRNQHREEVIRAVFCGYTPALHHAELIVRVVHLLALYRNLPEKLKEMSQVFSSLFNFYEKKIIPDLEKALPMIEARDRIEMQKKDRKISRLRKMISCGIVLGIILIFSGIYGTKLIFWTCRYSRLDPDEKILIENATLSYKNEKLQFQELFPINFTAYDVLSSEHCDQMLDSQELDFSSNGLHYLYDQVSKDSEFIRQIISDATIVYENTIVYFHDLFSSDSKAYVEISSNDIAKILKGDSLNFNDLMYLYEYVSVESKIIRKALSFAPVVYEDTLVMFKDLLPNDTLIYASLKAEHISQILSNQVLNFSDQHLHYLDIKVRHKWSTLSYNLTNKFLNSNCTFQNEIIKLQMIYDLSPESFDFLTHKQILEVLKGENLAIHKVIKTRAKFYVDRTFRNEKLEEIYFGFMKFIMSDTFGWMCFKFNTTGSSKTFEDFYHEYASETFDKQAVMLDDYELGINFCQFGDLVIRDRRTDLVIDSLLTQKLYTKGIDITEFFEEAKQKKAFILSSNAGTGKTTSFENFAVELKKQFPYNWVSYIDFKNHKSLYNSSDYVEDFEGLMNGILGLNSENEFEKYLFWDSFWNGKVTLLWNGFDEIPEQYMNFTLKLLSFIRENTTNVQFLCTRPLYSDTIKKILKVQTYTLIPLDDAKKNEFLTKTFMSLNVNGTLVPDYVEKVKKIINSTELNETLFKSIQDNDKIQIFMGRVVHMVGNTRESKDTFGTPLVLTMIADSISKDVKIYDSANLYEIYDTFVERKVDIWQKYEFGHRFVNKSLTAYRKFDIMELYQKNALEFEIDSYNYRDLMRLKIMNLDVPEELTTDEISRMGILYINGPNQIEFAHQTYAQYFRAQYFIDNIYLVKDLESDEEAEARIQAFMIITLARKRDGTVNFIRNFLQTDAAKKNLKIHPKLVTQNLDTIFFNWLRFSSSFETFKFLLDFLKNDKKLIKKLLHYDQNETIFTAQFNYYYHGYAENGIAPITLANLSQPFFNDDEFESFIYGKHQKGVALFTLHCFYVHHRIWYKHRDYELADELLKSTDDFYVFKAIAKNLTKPELYELLMRKRSPLYHRKLKMYSKENFWGFVEKNLTKMEQKELFMGAIDGKRINDEKILWDKILNLNFLMSDSEIFEYFSTKRIYRVLADNNFDRLYDLREYLKNHTTNEQQVILFSQTDYSKRLTEWKSSRLNQRVMSEIPLVD